MAKFKDSYQELQDKVLLTGVEGEWHDLGNQKQYRAESGAILNWWESSKTINFQGDKDEAKIFEAAFDGPSEARPAASARKAVSAKEEETKIFIVHGHDATSLEQLELILFKLGLQPYILKDNDGESRTLIEALEQQIYDRSSFGIVLMTPDDFGYTKDQDDENRQPRARQNVILEMGMIMASLGRGRMMLLKKGNLELPSDMQGVIYEEFNDHVREVAVKLARRIKGAGIDIDDAKIASAAS